MSDVLTEPNDDATARRHAAWTLLVLALVAVILVAIMLFVLGTSPKKKSAGGLLPGTGPAVVAPRTTPSPESSASSSSAVPSPGNTLHPCPGTAACVVSGDVGGLITAVNQLRSRHGLGAATGSVSPGAQQCALQQGSGPACAPHYAWQPVPKPDAAMVVSKIGEQWLLDPAMKTFHVGWAYVPGSATWECAVLKFV